MACDVCLRLAAAGAVGVPACVQDWQASTAPGLSARARQLQVLLNA